MPRDAHPPGGTIVTLVAGRAGVVTTGFRMMGSDARVVVVGGSSEHAARAERRLRALEALWSRFVATSEISRLNMAGGVPVAVSPETADLVAHLRDAWHATHGAFDPTLLPALVGAGYVASWDDATDRTRLPGDARWPGDPGGIAVDRERSVVSLPAGTAVDPGGLGKGLAADVVVAEILADGAEGALVSLGGDLRVGGRSPHGDGWRVAVEDPWDRSRALATVHLDAGGLATSAPRGHAWRDRGTPYHHLLDPRTGLPATAPIAAVTVVAGTAAWAEAFTKVPFTAGVEPGLARIDAAGLAAMVVGSGGRRAVTGRWDQLAVRRPEAAS